MTLLQAQVASSVTSLFLFFLPSASRSLSDPELIAATRANTVRQYALAVVKTNSCAAHHHHDIGTANGAVNVNTAVIRQQGVKQS